MLKILDENSFNDYIKKGLKLILFGTDLCTYCKKEQPILEDLAQNNIEIGKIDAYKSPYVTQKYGVMSFPTFIIFKNGEVSKQFSGYKTKPELLDILTNSI